MNDSEILHDIMTKLTVPLWPTAGRALGLGRNSTFEGAKTGEIKTITVGRRRPVPTAWLFGANALQGAYRIAATSEPTRSHSHSFVWTGAAFTAPLTVKNYQALWDCWHAQ